MEKAQRKRYIRLIYAKALRCFSAALVICAIAATLCGDRLHFVFALCAIGGILFAWSWFGYMHLTGFLLPGLKSTPGRQKVPYILRREKRRLHRPAFAMENDDFDDDLVQATSIQEGAFSHRQTQLARILARLLCGVLLFLLSFFIPV